jgi:hypothetical protein
MRLPSLQAVVIVFGTLALTIPELWGLFWPGPIQMRIAFGLSLAINSAFMILIWFGHYWMKNVAKNVGEVFLPDKMANLLNRFLK